MVDLSFTPDNCDLSSNVKSIASTIIAKIDEHGMVTNLKPSSKSASSAVIQSGRTKITSFEQIPNGPLALKTSNGLVCSRQTIAGPIMESYAKNLLKFTGFPDSTITENNSPTHGVYESVSGKKIAVLGYKTSTPAGIENGTVMIDGSD